MPRLQVSVLRDRTKQSKKRGSGGVNLGKEPHGKKRKMELKQVVRPLPTEIDDEIEHIDLPSSLPVDEEFLGLNKRVTVEQPVRWWINETGESVKYYKNGNLEGNPKGTSPYRPLCIEFPRDTSRLWRSTIGERITPTQINSLLTQNLSGISRPASTFPWWKQPDEGYYLSEAKKMLPEFIAETQENYYLIDENSRYRLRFKCPEIGKSDRNQRGSGVYDSDIGSEEDDNDDYDDSWRCYPPIGIGPILIHVDPDSGQARWYCPRCSKGKDIPVKHTIPRGLRDALAKAGLIPKKEYKYNDRLSEAPKLLSIITKNPGMSFYELDHAMGWDSDGRNSERIINKHLKNKVDLRRGRKGNKGYKVYIKH